jgi:hypothetical protein
MRRLRLTGLGLRLAFAGGLASVVRLALISLGLAFGICLLLTAASVPNVLHSRDVRDRARNAVEGRPGRTLVWGYGSIFEGRHFDVEALRPTGRGEPALPPGIPRLPSVGQAFVSPAMAQLLAERDADLLRPRVPGQVVGTIAPEGLIDPDEAIAYVGAPASFPLREASRVDSFGPGSQASAVDPGTLVLTVVLVVAFLVPIGLFTVTVTRLSAATRDVRYASVRLAGATETELRYLAAIEPGVAAAIGAVFGLLLFLIARVLLASSTVTGARAFVGDASPGVGWILIPIGVPLFAVMVTMATMRRLVVSPLGVTRRAYKRRRGWPWPVMLGLGCLLLWGGATHRTWLFGLPDPFPSVIAGAGFTLLLIGLAGTGPWLASLVSRRVAGAAPSPSLLLGSRRLEADTSSAARVVMGVAVLVALAGLGESILMSARGAQVTPAMEGLRTDQVVVSVFGDPGLLSVIADVSGVRSVDERRESPDGAQYSCRCFAILQTDGASATVERVRNALGLDGSALTGPEYRDVYTFRGDSRYASLLQLALVALLVVTVTGLFVTTVDGMLERRRPLATLSAIGVPGSVLRRSVFVQVGMPLAIALAVGAGVGVVATLLAFRLANEAAVIAGAQLLATTVTVGLLVLLVTAVTLPWLRVVKRPELLRND